LDHYDQQISQKQITLQGSFKAQNTEFMTEEERKDFEMALKLQQEYGYEEEPEERELTEEEQLKQALKASMKEAKKPKQAEVTEEEMIKKVL